MKNYLSNHTSLFEKLVAQAITLYRKPEEVEFSLIQEYSKSMMRVHIFLGHARWLVERGLCPVYALLYKIFIHILRMYWRTPESFSILWKIWKRMLSIGLILEKIKITDHDMIKEYRKYFPPDWSDDQIMQYIEIKSID